MFLTKALERKSWEILELVNYIRRQGGKLVFESCPSLEVHSFSRAPHEELVFHFVPSSSTGGLSVR
jgi:hypothetical protein